MGVLRVHARVPTAVLLKHFLREVQLWRCCALLCSPDRQGARCLPWHTSAGLDAIEPMNFILFDKDVVFQTLDSLENAQVTFCLCSQGFNREIP